MKINSEAEMIEYGEKFAQKLREATKTPVIIELTGDVGAGKTTFTRGLAKGLGVKEPISSPSFTISKSYAFGNKILTHYDFYRLADPGLMLEDLEEALNISSVTIIEWGDSIEDILPENRLKIDIKLNDDGSREITDL